jgi:site-specific DNA recombinase
MLMQWATGRRGGRYRYYFCRAKQIHECNTRYVDSDAIEDAIINFYGHLRFPDDIAEQMRTAMHEALEEEEQARKQLDQQLNTELLRLDRQEENLLDLVAEGGQTPTKVKERLNTIQRQRSKIRQQLDEASHQLAEGAALIENALQLLANPQDLYERMAPEQRRLMNSAIYDKLFVFEDTITEATFNPPFNDLLTLRDQWDRIPNRDNENGGHRDHTPDISLDGGSSKRVMVEVMGLEPTTSTLRT